MYNVETTSRIVSTNRYGKKLFGGVSSYVLRHSLGTNANELLI